MNAKHFNERWYINITLLQLMNKRGCEYMATVWLLPLTWSCWGAGWGPGWGFPGQAGGASGHWAAASAGAGSERRPHGELKLSAGAPWLLIPKRRFFGLNSQPSSLVCSLVFTWRTRANWRARYMAICASWGSNDWALQQSHANSHMTTWIMMWKAVQQLSNWRLFICVRMVY